LIGFGAAVVLGDDAVLTILARVVVIAVAIILRIAKVVDFAIQALAPV
jgi:hypothetical protein